MSNVMPNASSCFRLFDYSQSESDVEETIERVVNWLQAAKSSALDLSPYLQSIQFELQLLFLIQQLLQTIRENDVGIVESAVLLVKLVILINLFLHCSTLTQSLNSKVLQIRDILTF